jgi:hypothetical protein
MSKQAKRNLAVLVPLASLVLLGAGWAAWRYQQAYRNETAKAQES